MVFVAQRFRRHLGQVVKQAAQIFEYDNGPAPDLPGGKRAVADERIELRSFRCQIGDYPVTKQGQRDSTARGRRSSERIHIWIVVEFSGVAARGEGEPPHRLPERLQNEASKGVPVESREFLKMTFLQNYLRTVDGITLSPCRSPNRYLR
jgi:hypothetical protein